MNAIDIFHTRNGTSFCTSTSSLTWLTDPKPVAEWVQDERQESGDNKKLGGRAV